ncbi:MAG: exodeoxyribonuclease VII small subunit [Verrucomicrobiota bacterium]
MPKESSSTGSSIDPSLPFEAALESLEGLVREMESDQMPLEQLIQHYETGTQLFAVCEQRLDEARGRIEIIRKKRDGETVLEPFESDASESEPKSKESASPQQDGELF